MNDLAEKRGSKVDCRRCRHFQITWDPAFPRGCLAMGFKTRQWPCVEVLNTSGDVCMKFQPKRDMERPSGRGGGGADVPASPGAFSRMV